MVLVVLEGMVFLGEKELEELLDFKELINNIKRVLLSDSVAPLRASLEHNGVWLGAMPAAGLGMQAVKIVGLYPRNPERGLPYIRGVVLGFDEETGDVLFLADAGPVTGFRTAAASCLALELMGYRGEGPVGIIGAGVQSKYHARCIREVFRAEDFIVHDIDKVRAESFAEKMPSSVKVRTSRSLEEVLTDSRLVVSATTSREPVVKGSLLGEGVYVVSIGAPRPVWELDEVVLLRAKCLLVDTREGFLNESGEALHFPEDVETRELVEVLKGHGCGWGDLRVYKSVGTALFDLAASLTIREAIKSNFYE